MARSSDSVKRKRQTRSREECVKILTERGFTHMTQGLGRVLPLALVGDYSLRMEAERVLDRPRV